MESLMSERRLNVRLRCVLPLIPTTALLGGTHRYQSADSVFAISNIYIDSQIRSRSR